MSQLSAIRERIKTIRNLSKVTRAMELVTKTRINKVRLNGVNARNYQQLFARILEKVRPSKTDNIGESKQAAEVYYLAFFSQKGFCGNFNDKLLSNLSFALHRSADKINLILIGKLTSKITAGLRQFPFIHLEAKEKNHQKEFNPLTEELAAKIIQGAPLQIYFVYNSFKTILQQDPVVAKIYPFDSAKIKLGQEPLLEPSAEKLFPSLLPAYLGSCLEQAYWETIAGENCSRLMAMKNANDNAGLILDTLQINYNKTRQSKITQELSEIVSAFDVLYSSDQKKNHKEE